MADIGHYVMEDAPDRVFEIQALAGCTSFSNSLVNGTVIDEASTGIITFMWDLDLEVI